MRAARSYPMPVLWLLLVQSACGSLSVHGDAGDGDSSAGADAAPAVPSLNDCVAASYEDHTATMDPRRITAVGETGFMGRCSTILVGQSVSFEMDFSAHPLTPGIAHGSTAGETTPSPIQPQTFGSRYSVVFATPGYFPFLCGRHQHDGMAGVIRVLPVQR